MNIVNSIAILYTVFSIINYFLSGKINVFVILIGQILCCVIIWRATLGL